MTFPIDLHIGTVIIPSHFIFEVLAFYVGLRYFFYLLEKQKDPLSENNRWIVILSGLFGALVGSRLIAALERPYDFLHPHSLLFYIANQTVAGGIIGAILAVEIAKYFIGEKKKSGDLFVYPLTLGIIIGRIGCFLTGVSDGTTGLPSNLPWAFNQGDGIPRHPTALYEILFLLVLWLVLEIIQKKVKLKNGVLFKLFIISYTTFRFFVEFIKPIQILAFGLSVIQISCLCIALFYSATLLLSPVIDRQ
jgi:prolipoprotein diacylglyceryltransferase